MVLNGGSSNKKNLNVELNLMPVFDVLAVCICFLLMTVVWIQVGMIKTSQAMGGQSESETKKAPSVWVTIDDKSNVTFVYKNIKKNDASVRSARGSINLDTVQNQIQALAGSGIETALIIPSANTSYDSIIEIMDSFKQTGLLNIGISPL